MTYTFTEDFTSKSYLTRMVINLEREFSIVFQEACKYLDTDSPIGAALAAQSQLIMNQVMKLKKYYQIIHREELIIIKDYITGNYIVVPPKKPRKKKSRIINHNFNKTRTSTTDR